uniref:Synaptonemal complex central element protein 1 like n=1 Tax=Loxodonta africana TaxID=9785 RepID=G3TTC7_LOXAF
GQAKSSEKSEDLLAMVKKLQKAEGSLEPQIEDLINRINELQQDPAKKKASEELGEALALWEALHRELDSLNGEKVHLEEVLSKKQETLRILQLHCHKKESEVQSFSLLVIQLLTAQNKYLSIILRSQVGCQRTAGGPDGPAQGPLGISYAGAAIGPRDRCPGEQQGAAAYRGDAGAGEAGGGGAAAALAAGGSRHPTSERWAPPEPPGGHSRRVRVGRRSGR